MSNSLDPDQVRHFVGPDLDLNICKGYQQITLVGKELKVYNYMISMMKPADTHLSQMDFPTLISRTSPFPQFKGVGWYFPFFSNLMKKVNKQCLLDTPRKSQ